MISLVIRNLGTSILIGVFSCMTIASLGTAASFYSQSRQILQDRQSATLAGLNTYFRSMKIETFDPVSETMVATIENRAVRQTQNILVHVPKDVVIRRQDLFVENGVITRFGPVLSASSTDLLPGTNAYGQMSIAPDGSSELRYILIGDPNPRP